MISGGDRPVANDDFAVTVVGSDAYSHWVAGDTSVQIVGRDVTPEEPLFSETRLYYLGVSRDIPANTWVEVTLWLDEREVDPDYRYVTGIYIKNSMYYQSTYYVDRVSLLLRRPGGS